MVSLFLEDTGLTQGYGPKATETSEYWIPPKNNSLFIAPS